MKVCNVLDYVTFKPYGMKQYWLSLLLLLSFPVLQAQLKMNASGKVSIGNIVPSTNELEILGEKHNAKR